MDSGNIDSSKRSLINWLLGAGVFAWIGGIFAAFFQYLKPSQSNVANLNYISLGLESKLEDPKNKFKLKNNQMIFPFGEKKLILVKIDINKYKVFSAQCTHAGCIVEWKANEKIFFCNCHGGKFDINGKNIAGPPPSPLPEYKVVLKKGEMFVTERQNEV
ncbi:MAG: Rieske (2Fe-2S) protein [Spirochaetota bacterium]|nr:Rieske (2Fe-2S) protein [Spirochaetota bacterium]